MSTPNTSHQQLENLLQKSVYRDSMPDFDRVWKAYEYKNHRKEVSMAESKGGFKIAGWVVSFMLVVAVGWFGMMKFAMVKKQEKIQKGEAIVVTLVVGQVEVKKMGAQEWREVAIEDTLQMGDAVRTAAESYCELQMVSRGIFRVENNSELLLATLVSADDKVNSRMKLAKGGIALKPKELKSGEVFEVETSTAVAAVRGTKFSVNVDENGNTKVAVNEGKVAVQPVLASISQAREKGQVDDKAAELIKQDMAKTIEVVPGEEATLDKAKVEALDKAVAKAIDTVAQKEGGQITGDKLQATAEKAADPAVKKADKIPSLSESLALEVQKEAAPVAPGAKSKPEASLINALIQKQQISEEAKQKLDNLTEANIIAKATEMVKIKFETKPEAAEVFINDTLVGITPLEKLIEKGAKISIRVSKAGYEEQAKDVEVTPNMSFALELKQVETPVAVETVASNAAEPVVAAKVPGDLDWEKAVTVRAPGLDTEPVLYRGKIYVSSGNKLQILSTGGELIKSVSVVGEGLKLTRPVASDGQIYVGSDSTEGGIFAYSTDGTLLWKAEAGSQKYGAFPAAADGIVAVPTMDKGIKIYTKSGTLKTSIDSAVAIYSAPLILNQGTMLVYANESGDFIGYDLTTGTKKWSKNYNERILYPLVGGNDVIVALMRLSGKVMGISPADGSVVWSATFPELVKTKMNPVMSGSRVVFSSSGESSSVIVLNAARGTVISKIKVSDAISTPFLSEGKVYIGGASGKVMAYNLTDKKYDWTYKAAGKISLVAADQDGVYALTPANMVKLIK